MQIHKGWLRTTEPTPRVEKEQPVRHGIPPQECSACHDYFIPANAAQVYCTAPNCVRDRATKRQQERRRLQKMLQQADEQKQLSKQHMIDVKAEMRKRKGMRDEWPEVPGSYHKRRRTLRDG